MIRALLLGGFGTVLDWAAPFAEVDENALRRAHAEADSVVRLAPFPEFLAAWRELEAKEHEAKAESHEESDYAQRFTDALERVGAGKRQVRVLTRRMYTRYFAELEAKIRLAPDVVDMFRTLEDGVKIALVANAADGMMLRTALDRLDIFYRFDTLVVSGDPHLRVVKPHPRLFQEALAELDVAPEDALVVGDDPERDVAGAHALGMRAALVANPREGLRDAADRTVPAAAPPALAVLPSLREVPTLLGKLR